MTLVHTLHTRIIDIARKEQLFKPGQTLVVGLSGGADSTALLDLLATLPDFPVNLIVAHLNHCLRGTESDTDEQFCRALAERYSIPFETRRVDVAGVARADSLNLEDAGRRVRIEFFDELARRWKADSVVLAQHADDQAETVLMRLLRGSGMRGLSGMPWRNGRGYVRPLLDTSRKELESYLRERNLDWREDASNRDVCYLRNRIRHELLPLLEQYNPAIRTTLATTASILSEEDALLDSLSTDMAAQFCSFTDTSVSCRVSSLISQPLAMQRRIIRRMLSRLSGNLEHISHLHLGSILGIITAARPNLCINLPKGLVAVKEYDLLVIRPHRGTEAEATPVTISGPGMYPLQDGVSLLVECVPLPVNPDCGLAIAYIDGDKAPFPWRVRTFIPGDRIQPLGMKGRKKVKDIFINEKIPLDRRRRIPLVFSGTELIWVTGLRSSQYASVVGTSTSIIKVTLQTD